MIIFLFFFQEAYSFESKIKIITLMRNNQLIGDHYLLLQESRKPFVLQIEFLPLKNEKPIQLLGYSIKFNSHLGEISLGALSSEKLLVDAASIAVEENFALESDYYSKKLLLEPWLIRKAYNLKLHYLSPEISENYYFSLMYQKNKKVVRGFFAKNYDLIDIKLGINITDHLNNPYSLGFAGQALGWGLGCSFGKNHQTFGLSYGIGPVKIALTRLFDRNEITKKISCHYRFNKNLSSFITLGSNEEEKLLITGLKINL